MAIKFMQQEVDVILGNLKSSPEMRKILGPKPHISIFDAKVLSKQLYASKEKTPAYKKAVAEEKAKGSNKNKVNRFKKKYTGKKYKDVFDQSDTGVQQKIEDYCQAILGEYESLSFIPKVKGYQNAIVKGNYEYELLKKKPGTSIEFLISLTGDRGAPYDRFREINADIQTHFILRNEEYKSLFGIGKRDNFDQARKKVSSFQQIGHSDDDAVIQKKAKGVIAGLEDIEENAPEDIDLSYASESLGKLRNTTAALRKLFDIKVSLEHLQKYKLTDGNLNDGVTVKVSVESYTENQTKGRGKERQLEAKLKGLINELIADLKKEYANAEGNVEKQRSPSPMDIVRKSVVSGPLLNKILKKKVTKKIPPFVLKKLPPNQGLKTATAEGTVKGPRPTTSFGVIDAAVKSKLPKYKRTREDSVERGRVGEDTQDALTARAFINSNLQKQVERNMGRPALENVTGRFSESVNIVNAGYTGGQPHFDYTYNPIYRVFENGRDYSPNFDPRPLIEKSIRQLAASRLDTKFTLRRV